MNLILPLASDDIIEPVAGTGQLLFATGLGIAVIIVLIAWAKLHPFLSLTFGGLTVGLVAGVPLATGIETFTKGFGDTTASVGTLIALGAIFGKLLADSGGADQIVDTIIGGASQRMLPWAMAGVGAIIGLPMFFEIGLVLLMPVIYLVARRAQLSLIAVGIPALAGLSVMHGLVPPHPGPLTAIGNLDADLGITLAFGVAIAIPTVVLAGPVFAKVADRWVGDVAVPEGRLDETEGEGAGITDHRPSFGLTIFSVLLPVVLMMARALAEIIINDEGNTVQKVLDALGTPIVALLIAVIVGMFTLGRAAGMSREQISKSVESSLPGIAGIVLIVAAGGGFKNSLVETGVGTELARWAADSGVSVLLLAWFVAVLIRLATGSATVATVTASGLLVQLTDDLSRPEVSLMVLAIGAGSVFFSHVNDAGFWLVKEYFGMSVKQTIKSWSVMETVLSVTGLAFVLVVGAFV
ncbi:GntP family permease [Nocardioides jensenii]|uniref:GntP family permease n=1 Tax=Nocardioides jensenii TaxID=1843 RepID=UPI000831A5AB|nr:gluconate:H+ symporter [Nocardioides jensenii]